MTALEARTLYGNSNDGYVNCYKCPIHDTCNFDSATGYDDCWRKIAQTVSNPYWERITQMADRQREKGIKTYGQGLEANTVPDALKRIEYIQEELIDGLMYLEWLKEKLKGETE